MNQELKNVSVENKELIQFDLSLSSKSDLKVVIYKTKF